MKPIKIRVPLIFFSLLIVGVSTSTSAFGHGGGGRWYGGGWGGGARVGVYLGAPIGFNFGYSPYSYYRPPYYGPTYYSPAPVYYPPVQLPTQVIFTERRVNSPLNSPASLISSDENVQTSWWYYCAAANAYYPYINKCAGGWLRVAPQPDLNKQ